MPEVSSDNLTAMLAGRVMRWKVAPGRFIMAGRIWIPRSRFQPLNSFDDAFDLASIAAASLGLTIWTALVPREVRLGERVGTGTWRGCAWHSPTVQQNSG
jgi:hypothetical protein